MKRVMGFLCVATILTGLLIGVAQVPENVARVHYQRPAGDYEGWMLHVWEDSTDAVTWEQGLEVAGEDDYGVYWDVNLAEDAELLGMLVHKGDEKDPGPDMFVDVSDTNEFWLISGSATVYQEQPDPNNLAAGDLTTAKAHWLRPDLIAWDVEVADGMSFALHASSQAGLELTPRSRNGRRHLRTNSRRSGLARGGAGRISSSGWLHCLSSEHGNCRPSRAIAGRSNGHFYHAGRDGAGRHEFANPWCPGRALYRG